MDGLNLAARRLCSVRLRGPALATAEQVVGWFGAVQAQEYGPATWSLGQRTAGVDAATVERAFADGAILRTHVLRPTWHFVLPADLGWVLAATAPRVHATNAYYYRQQHLDEVVFRRSAEVLTAALCGGNQLTRAQVARVLAGAGIEAGGMRLAYLLMHAELEGLICSGAPAGRQHTYALLAERAPAAASWPDRDEAVRELVVRYFTSHGPATAKDLRWWSSLTLAEIRRGVAMAGARLRREVIDDVEYWSAPSGPTGTAPSPTVDLVQGYDEYVVAFTESKYIVDVSGVVRTGAARRVVPVHLVVLDGQLAGHWKRTETRHTVTVDAHLYAPLSPAQTRALGAAADRYGAFLGRRAVVTTTLLD